MTTIQLDAFQDKLASLTFFDPACGSGNFLTESYISLRRLENEIIKLRYKGQGIFGDIANPVKVNIHQFYGIEINDFAVSVATTALWIAEQQMLQETADLYDDNVMPPELRKAHRENNAAVMAAYGFDIKMSESDCVAQLFKLYQELMK